MQDIKSRKDIELLVNEFYKKVLQDDLIGFIFTDVAKISLEKHMPIMYNFWESILLDQLNYKGNPMTTHLDLNKKEPLKPMYFERWMLLWKKTLDEHYCGEVTEEAKRRAKLMAELMMYKIGQVH